MPRSYKHISNYEKEILELKSEWLTLSENGIRIWWNNRIIVNILFEKMNNELKYESVKIQTNTEYTSEYLDEILSRYKMVCNINKSKFVYGRKVKLKSNWRFIWFQSALISTNFIQNKSDCKNWKELWRMKS